MSLVGMALLGVQRLLGVAEVATGGTKLAGVDSQVEVFEHLGYPQQLRLVTGGLEMTAGLASHLRAGDKRGEMMLAAALLVLATVTTWNHAGIIV